MINFDKYIIENKLNDLKLKEHLIYYDGALLSHYIDEVNLNYFYLYVDFEPKVNRWLIFKVEEKDIEPYLNGEISLLTLILGNEKLILCDEFFDRNVYYEIDLSLMPDDYYPDVNSFYI
jgi:hypothetical protein